MAKQLIKNISEYVDLYRCDRTGIAWIEDGTTGNGHSAHPNIAASGSVAGMKKQGFWGISDQTARSHGFIYNISVCVIDDDLDLEAARHCECGADHTRGIERYLLSKDGGNEK